MKKKSINIISKTAKLFTILVFTTMVTANPVQAGPGAAIKGPPTKVVTPPPAKTLTPPPPPASKVTPPPQTAKKVAPPIKPISPPNVTKKPVKNLTKQFNTKKNKGLNIGRSYAPITDKSKITKNVKKVEKPAATQTKKSAFRTSTKTEKSSKKSDPSDLQKLLDETKVSSSGTQKLRQPSPKKNSIKAKDDNDQPP